MLITKSPEHNDTVTKEKHGSKIWCRGGSILIMLQVKIKIKHLVCSKEILYKTLEEYKYAFRWSVIERQASRNIRQ